VAVTTKSKSPDKRFDEVFHLHPVCPIEDDESMTIARSILPPHFSRKRFPQSSEVTALQLFVSTATAFTCLRWSCGVTLLWVPIKLIVLKLIVETCMTLLVSIADHWASSPSTSSYSSFTHVLQVTSHPSRRISVSNVCCK